MDQPDARSFQKDGEALLIGGAWIVSGLGS